jgi:fucose permease
MPPTADIRKRYLRQDLKILSLCNLSMMAMAIATNLPPVYFTTFSHAFGGQTGLTAEQIGRIGAFIFAGYVIGLLVSAPLADRLGAKPFMLIGSALLATSLVVIASAVNYAMLLGAVLLMGIGGGIIELLTSPIVSVLEPTRRTNVLNMLHSFYSLGAVLTILIASLLIYLGVSWRLTTIGMAVLPLSAFIGFIGVKLPPLVCDERRMSLRKLLLQKFFIVSLLAIALCGASELGIVQWLPAYAERGLGFTPWLGGLSLMFFSFGMFVGRWMAGRAGHHYSPFVLETAACILTAAFIALGSFIPHPTIALGACIFTGFAVSCLWPTMLAIVAGEFPAGGASMFGLLAAFGNAGGIIMPWLIGIVTDLTNLHIGLASNALAPAALLIFLAILARHRKSHLPNS